MALVAAAAGGIAMTAVAERAVPVEGVGQLARLGYGSVFAVVVLLSIVGTTWEVAGVPVRALAAGSALLAIALLSPRSMMAALRRARVTLRLIAGFAVLGAVVSFANETGWSEIGSEVVQIHLQAAVNFLLAYLVAKRIGAWRTGMVFIGCVALSGAVAVTQSAGFDWAWDLRLAVAELVGEDLRADHYYRNGRPMGLAFSPVRLGIQLCLALATYLIILHEPYRRFRGLDKRLIGAVVALTLVAAVSQNRAPILGVAVLLVGYVAIVWPRYIGFVVALAAVTVPFAVGYLDNLEGVRLASLGDDSAAARLSFAVYGAMLFVGRPLGYGLAFDPTQHWTDYWDALQWTPVPHFVRVFPLHNYPLTILNMYGAGVLLLMPAVWSIFRTYRVAFLSFVPYTVNIMFHNDGPMWSDFVVWFVFAIAVVPRDETTPASG